MKIQEAMRHFLKDRKVRARTENTLMSYTQRLGVLVDLLQNISQISDLEQVTVSHLRECVDYLQRAQFEERRGRRYEGRSLSANTLRGYVRVWRVSFNWCREEELINLSPATRLALPKPEKKIKPTLMPGHIDRLLNECDISTDLGFRDYAILLLLIDTGIRVAELCNIHLEDFHEDYIKIHGKGRKEREVGVFPEVSKVIWKYIHKYRIATDEDETHLFIGRRGPLTPDGVTEILLRVQRRSGLEDLQISPHVFRHTFAKWYLKQGGDLFKLSREMGHSDISITKIYLEDFDGTDARQDHNHYSPVRNVNLRKQQDRRKRKK